MHLQFKGGSGRESQFCLTGKKPLGFQKNPSYIEPRKYTISKNMSQWIF